MKTDLPWERAAIFKAAVTELAVLLTLGAAPCAWFFAYRGTADGVSFFSTLSPKIELVYYFGGLMLIALVVGFVSKYIYAPSDRLNHVVRWLASLFHEIGASVQGLIRVLAGALLALLGAWWVLEPTSLTPNRILTIVTLFSIAFIESIALNLIRSSAKKEFRIRDL